MDRPKVRYETACRYQNNAPPSVGAHKERRNSFLSSLEFLCRHSARRGRLRSLWLQPANLPWPFWRRPSAHCLCMDWVVSYPCFCQRWYLAEVEEEAQAQAKCSWKLPLKKSTMHTSLLSVLPMLKDVSGFARPRLHPHYPRSWRWRLWRLKEFTGQASAFVIWLPHSTSSPSSPSFHMLYTPGVFD